MKDVKLLDIPYLSYYNNRHRQQKQPPRDEEETTHVQQQQGTSSETTASVPSNYHRICSLQEYIQAVVVGSVSESELESSSNQHKLLATA